MKATPAEIEAKVARAAQENRAGYRNQLRAMARGQCRQCRNQAVRNTDGTTSPYCARHKEAARLYQRARRRRIAGADDAPPDASSVVEDAIATTRRCLVQVHRAAIALGLCPGCGAEVSRMAVAAGATHCANCRGG